jgi:SAM-dependent methyltransferase
MTSEFRDAGGPRSLMLRARQLLRLSASLNPYRVFKTIAELEARQLRLERAQREIESLLRDTQGKIEAALQAADVNTSLPGILDIKNLGYELGRRLAEEKLAPRPIRVDRSQLRSKLCTQDDFDTDWLVFWCNELRTAPFYHRKIWELCYVAQVLFADGLLSAGRHGLGFGCGEEPLPSLFAKYSARVTATDLDPDRPEAVAWRMTAQHAAAVEAVRRADICPDRELLEQIEFTPVDMNAIPPEFERQFDFCWSTCALEHLGTLANGLAFIENSVKTLKPHGLAVHTTEFTLNDGETIDNHPIVLYQRQHFEELASRLRANGHEVVDFDFNPGSGVMDRFIDLPPFRDNALIGPQHYAHLKLLFDRHTCTSIGIIIRAG